ADGRASRPSGSRSAAISIASLRTCDALRVLRTYHFAGMFHARNPPRRCRVRLARALPEYTTIIRSPAESLGSFAERTSSRSHDGYRVRQDRVLSDPNLLLSR